MKQINLPLIKAKFPGTCISTGLPVHTGDTVFYNPKDKTVIRAIKIFDIDTETDAGLLRYNDLMRTNSWLFKLVECCFDIYIDATNPAQELHDKYFSEDAIYNKKGAIQGAIEMIFEEMRENNDPYIWFHTVDLACAFQD